MWNISFSLFSLLQFITCKLFLCNKVVIAVVAYLTNNVKWFDINTCSFCYRKPDKFQVSFNGVNKLFHLSWLRGRLKTHFTYINESETARHIWRSESHGTFTYQQFSKQGNLEKWYSGINFVSLLSVTYTDRIKAWKFCGKLHKRGKYYSWPFRKESLKLPTLGGPPQGREGRGATRRSNCGSLTRKIVVLFW